MLMSINRSWKSTARGATALFALGMVGVVALAIYAVPTLRDIPELSTLSYPTLLLLAALQSTILLVVFVILGAVTAPRIDLNSHVFAWASGGSPDWGRYATHFRSRQRWAQACSSSSLSSMSHSHSLRSFLSMIPRRMQTPYVNSLRRFQCGCSTAASLRSSCFAGD